jgi:DNA-binding beta-propeller fold protein YncE
VLYVSDSGHHRVLECRHDGHVLRRFGSGNIGYSDGTAAQACFNEPQGLARWGDALYVADCGNHAVRRIDLGSGVVDTVLGTGRPGRSRPRAAESERTALNSPLDLAVLGDDLYIAVAGQHQIWRMDLAVHEVSVFSGSGELGLVDGPAEEACFAQPSGLEVTGRQLIVADAAASALRWVNADDGRVETALGSGLYEFGDATGVRADVRLQNPLAVAADSRGMIYIADSYNHSIKLLNRKTGDVRPLRLNYRLHEPQGLSLGGNLLWVANTNLHEIAVIDLMSGLAKRVPVGET